MLEATSTRSIDTVQRQIRRVRQRRNLLEAQRAVYLLTAALAAAATALLLLALHATEQIFAAAGWSLVLAIGITAAVLARALRRRWMSVEGTAGWIDRQGSLQGRLATLVELGQQGAGVVSPAQRRASAGRRDARTAQQHAPTVESFFMPLLVDQTVRRIGLWTPRRLVPHGVPRVALAAAVTATGVFLLALVLAGRVPPHLPEIVYSDRPIDGVEVETGDASTFDRVVVAPRAPRKSLSEESDGRLPGDGEEQPDPSALARLPGELQERIRREVWGDRWERMKDAIARAHGDGAPMRAQTGDHAGEHSEEESSEEWEDTRLAGEDAPPRPPHRAGDRTSGESATAKPADDAEQGTREDDEERGKASGEGVGASAGNDTDPNLFGPPSTFSEASGDTFELGIAAPVRTRRGAPRRTRGEAPPAQPDGRPELALEQRSEAALRKMTVPAAYESIVREVFAHRSPEE